MERKGAQGFVDGGSWMSGSSTMSMSILRAGAGAIAVVIGMVGATPLATASASRVEIFTSVQVEPGQPTGDIVTARGVSRTSPLTISWGDGQVEEVKTTCSSKRAKKRPRKCRIREGHVYDQPGAFEIRVQQGKRTLAVDTLFVIEADTDDGVDSLETRFEINSSWRSFMLTLVNDIRSKNGVGPIGACPRLDRIAQDYAQVMADTGHYAHNGPSGESPWDRYRLGGYNMSNGAENIAYGYPSTETVSQGWEDSEGHFRNIINPGLTSVGFGAAQSSYGRWYWVQNFGTGGKCDLGGATVETDAPLRVVDARHS